MSVEADLTPRVNCGIWTIIETFINKGTTGKIWDGNDVWPKQAASKKKEKTKFG